jgi:hypothetical protein
VGLACAKKPFRPIFCGNIPNGLHWGASGSEARGEARK